MGKRIIRNWCGRHLWGRLGCWVCVNRRRCWWHRRRFGSRCRRCGRSRRSGHGGWRWRRRRRGFGRFPPSQRGPQRRHVRCNCAVRILLGRRLHMPTHIGNHLRRGPFFCGNGHRTGCITCRIEVDAIIFSISLSVHTHLHTHNLIIPNNRCNIFNSRCLHIGPLCISTMIPHFHHLLCVELVQCGHFRHIVLDRGGLVVSVIAQIGNTHILQIILVVLVFC